MKKSFSLLLLIVLLFTNMNLVNALNYYDYYPYWKYSWKHQNIKDWETITLEWYLTFPVSRADDGAVYSIFKIPNILFAKYYLKSNWTYWVSAPIDEWISSSSPFALFYDEENKSYWASLNSYELDKDKKEKMANLWLPVYINENLKNHIDNNNWYEIADFYRDNNIEITYEVISEYGNYNQTSPLVPVKIIWTMKDLKLNWRWWIFPSEYTDLISYSVFDINFDPYEEDFVLCYDLAEKIKQNYLSKISYIPYWEFEHSEEDMNNFKNEYMDLMNVVKAKCKMSDYKIDTKVFVAEDIEINWKSLFDISPQYPKTNPFPESEEEKLIKRKIINKFPSEVVEWVLAQLKKNIISLWETSSEEYYKKRNAYDIIKKLHDLKQAELDIQIFDMEWWFKDGVEMAWLMCWMLGICVD